MEELRISLDAERLRLRLGPDSLLEHAPTEPPGPFLLQACRAWVVLASGSRDRVSLPLQGGAVLRLALSNGVSPEPHLAATVIACDGLLLLDEAEVPAGPFVTSLTEAMAEYLAGSSDASLAGSLGQAAELLAELPHLLRSRDPSVAPPIPFAKGPIELRHDGHNRLHLTLGLATVDLPEVPTGVLAEALVEGVEALLQTRDWPPGVQRVPLDTHRSRFLALRRTPDGLVATLTDASQHDLAAGTPLTLADLAWSALRCLQELPGVDAPRRRLLRLIRWEQALRRPSSATGRPPGWRPPPSDAPPIEPDRLPVGRLRHLAWRRVWRREAPGLLRAEPLGARLLVHEGSGLSALDGLTGEPHWRRPEARPLDMGDPGLATDSEGGLIDLNPSTGKVRSRVAPSDDGPFRGAWRVRGGLCAMNDATLFGVRSGRITWRYDTCFGLIHRVAIHGPLAWMTADDGMLHGLRWADGTRQFALPALGEPDEGPILTRHGLLLGTTREPEGRGMLALYDHLTGALRWRTTLRSTLLGPPLVVGDAVIQAHGGDEVTLECVGLADGLFRWRHRRLALGGRPRLAVVDRVLCKTSDGGLLALDAISGRICWSLEGEDDDAHLLRNPLPVRCRGVLLVPGTTVRAVDPRTGRLIRRLDCGELVPAWLHAWPNGDLVIAEDDAVAHYTLGGHLAIV